MDALGEGLVHARPARPVPAAIGDAVLVPHDGGSALLRDLDERTRIGRPVAAPQVEDAKGTRLVREQALEVLELDRAAVNGLVGPGNAIVAVEDSDLAGGSRGRSRDVPVPPEGLGRFRPALETTPDPAECLPHASPRASR